MGVGSPTPNGIRIGPVYTARAAWSRLRERFDGRESEQLDGGRRFCFLFTDLSNPTSNHIYQAIGYEPVADVAHIRFGDATD